MPESADVVGNSVTAVDDPIRWLAHLPRNAAVDLWGIMIASTPAARTDAVQAARDHGRTWGDVAIALALGSAQLPGPR